MTVYGTPSPSPLALIVLGWVLLVSFSQPLYAEKATQQPTQSGEDAPKAPGIEETLETLKNFVELRERLARDLTELNRALKRAPNDTEKEQLKSKIARAEKELQETSANFENIASNTDPIQLRGADDAPFNLKEEFFSLLEPVIKEMKHFSSDVRVKSDLRDEIDKYEQKLPIIELALQNINTYQKASSDRSLNNNLKELIDKWSKQQALIKSKLQAAQLQLTQLESEQKTLAETTRNLFRDFFHRRGWTLLKAVMVIFSILLLSRLIHRLLPRLVKGYNAKHRSFHIRLTDLLHRSTTIMLTILGPMIVFYMDQDWVLFSLSILLLIAIGWTLRHAIPRYWEQIEIFLNIGPVREGERLLLDGIPWRVERIHRFTTLENPLAGISQRVEIEDLVGMKSRPLKRGEPWFPCQKNDWVILKDGVRGKVTGISLELIQLIQRGGAICTYKMADFLALAPLNLSISFRLKETLGISYSLQRDSTNDILQTLKAYLTKRMEDEDYLKHLVNLNVEFQAAADSALELVVIADFKGEVADIYNRLRRAIQRWCVDACTEYGWEIPFPQLTLHGHLRSTEQ